MIYSSARHGSCGSWQRPAFPRPRRPALSGAKAYYDQIAAMPTEERDQLYRGRFDQIDTNHDGKLDPEERAAWRDKQREYYRQQPSERGGVVSQHP